MNESEIKKCPKCGGQMEIGHIDGTYDWNKGKDYYRLRHIPCILGYVCESCGYVEFYVERKVLSHEL